MLRQVTHDRAPVRIMQTRRGWPDVQSPTLAVLLEIITDARNPNFFCCDKEKYSKTGFTKTLQTKSWQTSRVHGQIWITSSKRSIFREMRLKWDNSGEARQRPTLPVPLEQNAKKKIARLRSVCGIATEQTPH